MKLGQIVGKGTSSEVYDIGDGKVFKLFLPGYPQQMIGYEARVSKTVYETGVRCPQAYGVEEYQGRQGIVYEKIDGPAFLRILGPQAYKLVPYARLLSNLQKSFHKVKGLDLPSQKLLFKDWIEIAPHLTDKRKDRILKVLESLPDGDALCHNDFHPDNIIMSKSGPVIIDWVNARIGDPMADVAITHLIVKKVTSTMTSKARQQLQFSGKCMDHAIRVSISVVIRNWQKGWIAGYLLPHQPDLSTILMMNDQD